MSGKPRKFQTDFRHRINNKETGYWEDDNPFLSGVNRLNLGNKKIVIWVLTSIEYVKR